MNKLEIAQELLKNTTNIHGKAMIRDYIANMNGYIEAHISENDIDIRDEGIALDLCFIYIEKENFDMTDWYLFENPIEEVYCFANDKTGRVFDLVLSETNGYVSPAYLNSQSKQVDVNSIQEAIEKYYIPD